jgi:EpsI family protein
MGTTRIEPVTYWIVIGREIALTGLEKRLAELRHSLRGEIVDGVLFRVSTIDANTQRAYEIQDNFVNNLLSSLKPDTRPRLAGLRSTP